MTDRPAEGEPVLGAAADEVMDWALRERLGGGAPPDLLAGVRAKLADGAESAPHRTSRRSFWWAAAAILLGTAVVFAAALADESDPAHDGPLPATPVAAGDPVRVATRAEIEALPADTAHVIATGIEDDELPALLRLRSLATLELQARIPLPGAKSPEGPVETVTDAGVAILTSLAGLRTLRLRDQDEVTAAGLAHLQKLENLASLAMLQMEVGADVLAAIAALPALRELELEYCTGFTREGMAHVFGMRQLVGLHLAHNAELEPDWLAGLGRLERLETLDLGYIGSRRFDNRATRPGALASRHLRPLQELSRLESLSLAGSEVDAWGLAQLRALPLVRIDLTDRGGIDDIDIRALGELAQLRQLTVGPRDFVAQPDPFAAIRRLTGIERVVVGQNVVDLTDRDEPARVASRTEIEALPADTRHVIATGVGDEALPALLRLRELESLEFHAIWPSPFRPAQPLRPHGTLTDAGLERLAGMTNLRRLALVSQVNLTGRALGVLRHLPGLDQFEVSMSEIDDDGFAVLAELPKLRAVELAYCHGIGDATLARLAKMKALRTVSLRGNCHLDEAAIAGLAALPEIARLDLGFIGSHTSFSGLSPIEIPPPGSGVTDAVCAALAEARSLRELDLSHAAVTHAGLAHLETSALTSLRLDGTSIGGEDLAHLPRTLTSLSLAGTTENWSSLGDILAEATPGLAALDLRSSRADDLCVGSLRSLPALRSLELGYCKQLTGRAVEALLQLDQLEALDLDGLAIATPARVEQLRALPALRRLVVETDSAGGR